MMNETDSSNAAYAIQHAVANIQQEWTRPSVLFKPRLYQDGDAFIVQLGDDFMTGVTGSGNTPYEAMADFDAQFYKNAPKGMALGAKMKAEAA
jgi:hypothetical protein